MSQSRYVNDDHWPFVNFPETLFEYFRCITIGIEFDDLGCFNERQQFINALNSHPNFAEFWTFVREQHPEKKDYFLALSNEEESFNSGWIQWQYKEYRQKKTFEELSPVERWILEIKFDNLWPVAYGAALEGEALRLNCDVSEVQPTSVVLSWEPYHEEESSLVNLPDEIFARMFPLLDSLDIFRMTLVCKRWKMIVHKNSMELKRAEHAVTTHIITFNEWMDPTKTPCASLFEKQYEKFSWGLTEWYCGISKNLETLVFDYPVHYVDLAELLQSCPKLKHLQIASHRQEYTRKNNMIPATVHLRHLEVFLTSYSDSIFAEYQGMPPRHLHRDVLISSDNLRVFRGLLNLEDCSFIEAQKPMSMVFDNLVALDLENFTTPVIEILSRTDALQLRYLRLGYYDRSSELDSFDDDKQRTRNVLHQLLPKLGQLEVLVTSPDVTITNETIQLLIDLELGLSVAVFYHAYFCVENELEEMEPLFEIDPVQPDVLMDFEDMLVSKNPDMDLSEIQFVLKNGEVLDELEDELTDFTFVSLSNDCDEASSHNDLCVPRIKRYLDIDF